MSEALSKYMDDLGVVDRFRETNPTLSHQRRAVGQNGRLAEPEEVEHFVGKIINQAGTDFLAGIHQEIHDALPQWKKDAIQKELDELAGVVEDDSPYVPPMASPEEMVAEVGVA